MRIIFLSQSSYINSILTQFNFTDLKPLATPMDPLICFSKDQCPQMLEETVEMSKVPYWEAVGSLNYCAVATWPNIAFSVLLLAQFMDNPGRIHWEAVKQVFLLWLWTICYIEPVLAFGTEQDIIVNSCHLRSQRSQRSVCLMSVSKSATVKWYLLRLRTMYLS
jgi:hypothetical protein